MEAVTRHTDTFRARSRVTNSGGVNSQQPIDLPVVGSVPLQQAAIGVFVLLLVIVLASRGGGSDSRGFEIRDIK